MYLQCMMQITLSRPLVLIANYPGGAIVYHFFIYQDSIKQMKHVMFKMDAYGISLIFVMNLSEQMSIR